MQVQEVPTMGKNKEREKIEEGKRRRSSVCDNATKGIARGEAGASY